MNRVQANFMQWFITREGWLYYEGCRNPWRKIQSIEVLPNNRYKVTFPDRTWRTFDHDEPIYIEVV